MTMMVMIQGLNPQFELLQQQLFLSPKLSLEDCRGVIMEQCERICIQQSVPTTTAYKADVSTHHTSPKCVHCGRFNHISDDCWLKTSNKGKSRQPVRNRPPQPKGIGKSSTAPTAWHAKAHTGKLSISGSPPPPGTLTFELDSGASEHYVHYIPSICPYFPSRQSTSSLDSCRGNPR